MILNLIAQIYLEQICGRINGPVCFQLAYNLSVAERSEDFLASRFSLLVVQIFEADYHRSKNKRDVWWDYRLFPPISRL